MPFRSPQGLAALVRVLCLAACVALLPGAAQAQGVSGNEQHNQLGGEPGAGADATACAPRIISVQAARAPHGARPTEGWVAVTLPDVWTRRWPGHDGTVWYRIDWQRGCARAAGPVALGIDGISVAGEVYINDELLWRDASLAEPLSRSWNVPRWWLLPESALHPGVNAVWVRAVGPAALSPGLGAVRLGDARTVAEEQRHSQWRQRTVYLINAVVCAMSGALFLLVWLLRRREAAGPAYGWFGLMALAWLAYLTTYLAETQWPWPDSIARARFGMVALVAYVLCACRFTFSFGGQHLPWAWRALWLLAALGAGAAVFAPAAAAGAWFGWVWQAAMAVFLANCVQFQWHAWRARPGGRRPEHMLLALAWLVFLVVALFDFFSVLDRWQVARNWAALSGLLVIVLVVLLLGGQLVQHMGSVERFNRDLEQGVAKARAELAAALAREHAQALQTAKLHERMQLAHDLHDGLGASLVRGLALVEQAKAPLPNERVLSILKVLRDDLRQVIDHGSSAGATVPDTPVQWAAPLRHRFTRLLDEMGVASSWHIAPQWRERPSALQCLGLTRLVEEALSNVVKHSRARHLRVECGQPQPDTLVVRVEDDGVGFDVLAVQRAGMSVGMRSMAARAERMGGTLTVRSGPSGTLVGVSMLLNQ